MGVGIYFDMRNPPGWRRPGDAHYARALELSEHAEKLGATSVWVSEHHLFEDGYVPQPLTFLAAVAARTERVRLGTAVLLAPLRSAVQIAEEAALVDLLSGGRLELGLGAGYRQPEFELFGAEHGARWKTTDSRVVELRRIWSEGRVTPPAVQQPIPLWLGYQGPVGARRAGRMGVGLLSLRPSLLEPYAQGLSAGGYPASSARTAGMVHAVLTRDPDRTWSRLKRHLTYMWDTYARYGVEGTNSPVPPPIDADAWRRLPESSDQLPRFLVATPEDAAERLNRYLAGRPIQEVFFWTSIAGMPDDLVDEHVELVCRELRPRLTEVSWT
jgi:alkanesulfonate monooxygenase SsuD/methylene tetrahydromethanopterin reductase-like flavin-dependent oxidoreductase (luciferase family)